MRQLMQERTRSSEGRFVIAVALIAILMSGDVVAAAVNQETADRAGLISYAGAP